jgi:beta-lactamase regulating signal transducer with metallopeptidase domain
MNRIAQWLIGLVEQPATALILDVTVKATLLVFLAMLVLRLRPRASAALRHRVWCLVFCGLVALPVLCYLLPGLAVPILPARAEEPDAIAQSETTASAKEVSDTHAAIAPPPGVPLADAWASERGTRSSLTAFELTDNDLRVETAPVSAVPDDAAIVTAPEQPEPSRLAPAFNPVAIWLVGAALSLLPLIAGLVRSAALRAKARNILDASWIALRDQLCVRLGLKRQAKLLEVDAPIIPLSCGVVRPAVVLPHSACEWNEPLRRFVLLHELSHIKRHDVVFQLVARLACALYWFHPLVWYALYRLRVERELACDDSVLAAGERPSEYAEQLLEVARRLQPVRLHAAVAMAQSNKLERRVSLLFSRARSHLPLSTWTSRLLLACAVGIVIAVSVIRPSARATDEDARAVAEQETPNEESLAPSENATTRTINGRVVGPDGRAVAGAQVLVVDHSEDEFGRRVRTRKPLTRITTDADGRFSAPVPAELKEAYVYLLATAPGYGPAWEYTDAVGVKEECLLKLAPDDVPLEGRVLLPCARSPPQRSESKTGSRGRKKTRRNDPRKHSPTIIISASPTARPLSTFQRCRRPISSIPKRARPRQRTPRAASG